MSEAKEVKVTNMAIKIGKKELNLTIEEAHKLKEALDQIFVTKEIVKETHIHHHDWYWHYPTWTYTYPSYPLYATTTQGSFTSSATAGGLTAGDAQCSITYGGTGYINCSIPMIEDKNAD